MSRLGEKNKKEGFEDNSDQKKKKFGEKGRGAFKTEFTAVGVKTKNKDKKNTR